MQHTFLKSAVSKKLNFSEISVNTFITSNAKKKQKFILFEYDTRKEAEDAYEMSRKHPNLSVICEPPMPTSRKSKSETDPKIGFYVPTTTQVVEITTWMKPSVSRSLCCRYDRTTFRTTTYNFPTIYISSAEFRWFFGTLIKSLGEMHMAGHFHGKLKSGVFFDAEKRILLANFDTSNGLDLLKGMRKDLSELIEMMKEAKGTLASNNWPDDFEDFRAKVYGLDESNHTDMFHLYFVYNHPLFFTEKEGVSFIHSFDAFTKSSLMSVQYGPEVVGWWYIIEMIISDVELGLSANDTELYLHKTYHHGEVRDENGYFIVQNKYRGKMNSFGLFLRNCMEHRLPGDEVKTFRLLKLIWPEMLVWLHYGLWLYGETFFPKIKMHFSVYTWQVSEFEVETYNV